MGSSERREQLKREKKKRKDEARRQRAAATGARAGQPGIAPTRFTVQYATPEALVAAGPLVNASWLVPPAHADALRGAGRSVPPAVDGAMLVDTGASSTCISQQAASDLGLLPVRIGTTYGAGGLHQNPVYEVVLRIAITDGTGASSVISSQMQAMAIPELDKHLQQLGVQGTHGPLKLIGLLGRDFLRHATLIYSGAKGRVEVQIDPSSLPSGAPPV